MASFSPNRTLPSDLNQSYNKSAVLERSLILNKNRHRLKESLWWFAINTVLLAIVVYDLSQTCPLEMSFFHYIEYSLTIVFTLNVFFYFGRIVRLYFTSTSKEMIPVTAEQKKLLGVKDSDPNYTLISPGQSPLKQSATPLQSNTPLNMTALSWRSKSSPQQQTPLNMTALSWRSDLSMGDSMRVNYTNQSTWSSLTTREAPESESHAEFEDANEEIESEFDVEHTEDEEEEDVNAVENKVQTGNNLLSSFWSHPVTRTAADMSEFLKSCTYQLSSPSPTKKLSGSPSTKSDDKSSGTVPVLEVWTGINVDTVALTQWNENLRMWISRTILERLVLEIETINEALEKHNMSDMKIGAVGLDRLRKTATTSQISHFIPSLSPIIPFLEVHTNQEYVVKRIRELTRGGCMSEFKWNSGGYFNGKDWEDSLPTDCAIVMHLFASYLDTQLMPSPNLPDAKAFSSHYYLKADRKSVV